MYNSVTGSQIKAARQLLKWATSDLAEHAKLTRAQVGNIENDRSFSVDVYQAVCNALHSKGIRFLASGGVDIVKDELIIYEGANHFMDVLNHAHRALPAAGNAEILLLFASDHLSPPDIVNKYRAMRSDGITMRQIISADDDYLLGDFDEYRQIPPSLFAGLLTVIYGNVVFQSSANDYRSIALVDQKIADSNRSIFEIIWNFGRKPTSTSAGERFE